MEEKHVLEEERNMLKKCVVIMVMFTLVAGAVSAQVTFGGQLQEGVTLFSGNNVNGTDIRVGDGYYVDGPYHEGKFSARFGDSKAGGRLVYCANDNFTWGWMQWRPNQFFRVKIGSDGDGEWGGFAQIIDWTFTGEAKNSVAAVSDYGGGGLAMQYRNSGLNYGGYGGRGDFNLGMSVFPSDIVQVDFLFRKFANDNLGMEISERFAKLEIASAFTLDFGTIRFAVEGKGGLAKDQPDGADIATLHLAFYSKIVPGLAFEIGGQYNLPHLNQSDTFDAITVGGGLNLTGTDPFNLKLRFGTLFGGQKEGEDLDKFGMSIGLLPSYKLPKMTVFLHMGFGTEKEGDSDLAYNWFVNPYIAVPLGGMTMWLGVQIIDEHAVQEGQFKWAIPFGFNFYF